MTALHAPFSLLLAEPRQRAPARLDPERPFKEPFLTLAPGGDAMSEPGGMDGPSDLELVAEAQQDPGASRQAFAQLVKRYERPLFQFIVRQVRERALAEEIFQETFLRAYRGLGAFAPQASEASVRGWLYRIATNACRDELRSARSKASRAGDPEAAERLASGGPGPEGDASTRQRAELVRLALAQLTATQREVIVLFQYQGLTYPEIAEVLGVPLGTVKSRMHAALSALGRVLQGNPELVASESAS